MVRVLLVYSNTMKEAWIPIGLLYIAAYLRENGIDVKIVDSKFDDVLSVVESFRPHYVGLGGMTVMAGGALRLGQQIREAHPSATLVYGGVHFTFLPDEAKQVADIIVKGEGEKVFLDIARGADLATIPGILYKDHGEWIDTGDWKMIEDLDSLPFPAYDMIDINKYSDELVTGERAISILTGRGCPYACTFCASPKLWKRKTRFHSIDYTMRHIKYLIDTYGLKNLRIMDDTFTCNNSRVLEFCKAIKENGFNLKMTCLTNVNNADLEVFQEMKSAGFDIVAFGLESVDENVLRLARKANSEKKMRRAVELAHAAGLRTELLFMVGNMGETNKSIRDSLAFSKSLNGYKTYFQLATPFPGSVFYDEAEQYGEVLDRDWDNYNHKVVKYLPHGMDTETMYSAVAEGTQDGQ